MILIARLLLPILAVVAASVAFAQSNDKPRFLGLEDVPGARALVREHKQDTGYTLALGTYKKVRGTWTPDREQRVQGDVSRRTLELPPEFSAREGYDFYLQQLQQFPVRELFVCRERECGSSNTWANTHFQVIQLYGLDQHQYYGVYEITTDEKVYYASLYSVRRGNRRVYVQLDLVQSGIAEASLTATDPSTLARLLREQGYFVFPGFELTGSSDDWDLKLPEKHLDVLVDLLEAEDTWRLALVGHDYGGYTLTQQRKDSEGYARQLKQALVEKGVSEERLETYGLGSLAPAGKADRNARIEVVRLPEE